MIRNCRTAVVSLALAAAAGAAPMSVGSHRDALVAVDQIRNWIVGADSAWLRRDLKVDGLPARLEAESYAVFLGLRLAHWLTLHGDVGHADADVDNVQMDDGLIWGAGLQARLWRHDLKDPVFLAGRWSIRLGAGYRRADVEAGEWDVISAAAVVHFEIFAETAAATERIPFSLGLYAGPVYSRIEGQVEDLPPSEDFEGESVLGAVGGVEVHLSHNFLLALGAEFVDGTSWSVSVRHSF